MNPSRNSAEEWNTKLFGERAECCAGEVAELGVWFGPCKDGKNHRPWCPEAIASGSTWETEARARTTASDDFLRLTALATELRLRAESARLHHFPAIVWPLTPDKAIEYADLFERVVKRGSDRCQLL